MKVESSFGRSIHEIVEFKALGGRSRAISRITTLDFKRANFDLLGGIPCARALEGKWAEENW